MWRIRRGQGSHYSQGGLWVSVVFHHNCRRRSLKQQTLPAHCSAGWMGRPRCLVRPLPCLQTLGAGSPPWSPPSERRATLPFRMLLEPGICTQDGVPGTPGGLRAWGASPLLQPPSRKRVTQGSPAFSQYQRAWGAAPRPTSLLSGSRKSSLLLGHRGAEREGRVGRGACVSIRGSSCRRHFLRPSPGSAASGFAREGALLCLRVSQTVRLLSFAFHLWLSPQ